MWRWLRCVVRGPDVYHVHGRGAYEASSLEGLATWAMGWVETAQTMAKVFSPVLLIVLYRRNFFSSFEGGLTVAIYVCVFYALCLTARTVGRMGNPNYSNFSCALNKPTSLVTHPSPTTIFRSPSEHLSALRAFDFDTWAWPVTYEWEEHRSPPLYRLPSVTEGDAASPSLRNSLVDGATSVVSTIVAHTIGISLMYPGTFFSKGNPMIVDGRRKLVEVHKGERSIVKSRLGDHIDTLFIDRRADGSDVLLVTCEGNCGFYEVGVGTLAAESSHSVLAWNTPGFAGSDGCPWPANSAAAIDVVVQYAVHKLHYAPDKIVVFAWSIGGYAATWLSMQYPDTLGGVILDATFDDVLPLAETVLPPLFHPIVRSTVRNHLDLPNGRQLVLYNGPVLIIRRSRDEIITGRPHGDAPERLRHNRSNDLLRLLLAHRYPQLFHTEGGGVDDEVIAHLTAYIEAPDAIHRAVLLSQGDTAQLRQLILLAVGGGESAHFPLPLPESVLLTSASRARMAVHLAAHYMIDVDIGHNDKLPMHTFKLPSHPWLDGPQ